VDKVSRFTLVQKSSEQSFYDKTYEMLIFLAALSKTVFSMRAIYQMQTSRVARLSIVLFFGQISPALI
jgi:hypothetical protein